MTKIFETPEEVAQYLGGTGGGMPPPFAGPGEYLRSGDFGGPIVEGALLALDGDSPAARAESLYILQGLGSKEMIEKTRDVLEHEPKWWNETDPHRGGTFGERFLAMCTYGEAARDKVLSELLLARSKGTAVEGEVERAVMAWRR